MKDSRVVALFGKSCVGKSEVAAKLAIRLSLPVRHCGELVKDRAKQLGIPASALSSAEHQAIDSETLSLAAKDHADIIMEGSFLDIVLADVPAAILVQLTCEDDERRSRYAIRSPGALMTLEIRDENDRKLRSELLRTPGRFDSEAPLCKEVTVDTTELSSDEVASQIIKMFGKLS